MMRHAGPLAFFKDRDESDPNDPPVHGLFIEKFTDGEKGVRRYVGNDLGPNGEESFGKAIDMAGPAFHNGNPEVLPDLVTGAPRRLLDIDRLAGLPSIFLDDGILYTAAKTRDSLTITLKQRNEDNRILEPFASIIGANLFLNDGEKVQLRWRNQGKPAILDLQPVAGTSYEIYVINDPLYESAVITNPILDPKHDEFAEYYKLLSAVPTDIQFRLQVQFPADTPVEKGSTHIPCMPITSGGG
jgi:hypothetical protein